MLSIGVAIISTVFSFLFVRHLSLLYAFNASFYLLLIEICKMLLCLVCMNCIKRHKMQIRWGFLVNALLYALVNTLAFYVLRPYHRACDLRGAYPAQKCSGWSCFQLSDAPAPVQTCSVRGSVCSLLGLHVCQNERHGRRYLSWCSSHDHHAGRSASSHVVYLD